MVKQLFPLERYLLKWLVTPIPLPYVLTIILYTIAEYVVVWGLFKIDHATFIDFLIPISCGLLGINSIAIFTIHLNNYLHNSNNAFLSIIDLENDRKREVLSGLLNKNIYNNKKITFIILLIVIMLSAITFFGIGLSFPSQFITTLAYIASFLIMIFAGSFGVTAIGIWKFMYHAGKLPLKIQVLHPDNLGGLEKIGRLGSRLFYMFTWLFILFSMGAVYTPYRNLEIRQYAYLWILFAITFLIISFFLPSYSFHKALQKKKEKMLDELSLIFNRASDQFSEGIILMKDNHVKINFTEIQRLIIILQYFEGKINNLNVWLYPKPFMKVGIAVVSQLLIFLLQQYGTYLNTYLFPGK